jgi:hypothetical protein
MYRSVHNSIRQGPVLWAIPYWDALKSTATLLPISALPDRCKTFKNTGIPFVLTNPFSNPY